MARFIANIQAGLLIGCAIAAVVIGIIGYVGLPMKWLHDPSDYVLVLLGLLAIAIGIERLSTFRSLEQGLDRLQSDLASLHRSGTVRIMRSYDEVYDTGCQYLGDAKRQIRAIVTAGVFTAPEKYRNRLAEILMAAKKRNSPVHNDIVIAAGQSGRSPDILEQAANRDAFYTKRGVAEFIHTYFVSMSAGFDMLIIDELHVMLSFNVVRGSGHVQSGLAFINQPEIAIEMARWFDSVLIPSAVPQKDKIP